MDVLVGQDGEWWLKAISPPLLVAGPFDRLDVRLALVGFGYVVLKMPLDALLSDGDLHELKVANDDLADHDGALRDALGHVLVARQHVAKGLLRGRE